MASHFDESEFVDSDYQHSKSSFAAPASPAVLSKPPSTQELENRAGEAQQRLAELKRAQEQLERERTALEEARRRRVELQTGREEMLRHFSRGIALLEEAELKARRDAQRMAQSLEGLREHSAKLQGIIEDSWTDANWNTELSRALGIIDSARMEWNTALLKWEVLDPDPVAGRDQVEPARNLPFSSENASFAKLCRLGLAVTWPVAVALLAGFAMLAVLLSRR